MQQLCMCAESGHGSVTVIESRGTNLWLLITARNLVWEEVWELPNASAAASPAGMSEQIVFGFHPLTQSQASWCGRRFGTCPTAPPSPPGSCSSSLLGPWSAAGSSSAASGAGKRSTLDSWLRTQLGVFLIAISAGAMVSWFFKRRIWCR